MNNYSVTIEVHLRSLSIDGGEPIGIPDSVKNVSQFHDWFADNEIGELSHLSQAIAILRSYLGDLFTNSESFDQVRNRK